MTPDGYGREARKLADKHVDAIQKADTTTSIVTSLTTMNSQLQAVIGDSSMGGLLSASKLMELQASCLAIRTAAIGAISNRDLRQDEAAVCTPPAAIQGLMRAIAPYVVSADELESKCTPLVESAWSHLTELQACLDGVSGSLGSHAPAVATLTFDNGGLTGSQMHPIRASLIALAHGNAMVYFILALAVILDGLILLCGVAGAAPTSFLEMEDQGDLIIFRESGVETVCMAQALLDEPLDERGEASHLGFLRRFLRAMTPCTKLARAGFVAIIDHSYVNEQRITPVIAVLLHLELIAEAESVAREVCSWDNLAPDSIQVSGFAVRTKMVLWSCQQLADYAAGRRDLPSLIDALKDLSPDLSQHFGSQQ